MNVPESREPEILYLLRLTPNAGWELGDPIHSKKATSAQIFFASRRALSACEGNYRTISFATFVSGSPIFSHILAWALMTPRIPCEHRGA